MILKAKKQSAKHATRGKLVVSNVVNKATRKVMTAPRRVKTLMEVSAGDKELLNAMIAASKDPDDPPLIFDWDDTNVAAFFANAVAYAGAVPAPASFVPLPANTNATRRAILLHVCATLPGAGVAVRLLGACAAGLACNQLQSHTAAVQLSQLHTHPWFAAVAVGIPGPLAEILLPRAKVSNGACDRLAMGTPLWL